MEYFLEKTIQQISESIAKLLDVEVGLVAVEAANPKFDADLAVPLFRFASGEQNPQQLAQKVADELDLSVVDRVEAVSGFVNIWLNAPELADGLFADVAKVKILHSSYGFNISHKDKEVVVEFTDPNPFKELHIGHAYSNSVGESLSRLFEAGGAKVHRVTYGGDVGMHVAKALWGIQRLEQEESIDFQNLNEPDRAPFLGRAYSRGARAFDEDKAATDEIKIINKKVYAQSDAEITSLYETGRRWSFDYFKQMYDRLGVHFDKHYLESESTPKGLEVVAEGLEKGVFEHSDGAVIFRGETYGLHTRVFINNEGLPTYEAKDLGLMYLKDTDYHYDRSIYLTGNEQSEYFKVMLKAAELLQPELAKKTTHLSHGVVKLSSGKMSSRSGDVVTVKSLLDTVEDTLREQNPDAPSTVDNALGAFKYAMLKHTLGSDIVYDVEESLDVTGNSGPYIQYSAVRVGSILDKVEATDAEVGTYDWQPEKKLLLLLLSYPQTIQTATDNYEPHHICNYVYALARELNRYYESVSVKDAPENEKAARLQLLRTIQHTMNHALGLLNIPVPEKM